MNTLSVICPHLNDFSSETPGAIFFNFHVKPSFNGGLKICLNGHGSLRWPPCPYVVKTLKNLLQNQESFKG